MRANHSKKFFSLLTAFLMILSLVSLPAVTAFADDSQPASSQPAASQPADTPTDTPPANPQPAAVLPSDCGLASLTVSGGAASYDLLSNSQDKNTYALSVGAEVDSAAISAAASDPLAQVGGDTGTVKLSAGNNAFKVTVTAQDGTTKEYDITITRANPPVKAMDTGAPWLTGISVNNGSTVYTLDPAFNKDTKSYKVSVPSDVAAVDLEGTPSDGAAVSGGGELNLNYGDNACGLTVSLSGVSTEYDLTITRGAPDSGAFQGFCFENKGSYMVITGYDGDGDSPVIPGTIYGLPVTAIGDDAFCCKCIKSVVMPDSITGIGNRAFNNCGDLANVVFGSGLKSIGDYAFQECGSIAALTLPDSLETIGEGAFLDCSSLGSLNITKNVSSIGDKFAYGSGIGTITVDAASVNYAVQDKMLFSYDKKTLILCPSQNSFDGGQYTIPGSVETISAYAFSDCGNLDEVTVPGNVKNISEGAFEGCDNLESITLSEGLTMIGDYAFECCGSLDNITLPASLSEVSGLSFAGCYSLSKIGVAAGSADYTSSADGVLYSAYGKVLVACPGGYWNKDDGCGKIKAAGKVKALCYSGPEDNSFVVPGTVNEIGAGAFAETGVTDVDFGSGVTKIDKYAFYECYEMQVIKIPDSVKTIDKDAFGECCSLQGLTLGTGLETLSPAAFEYCGSLTAIYFCGNAPAVDTSGDIFPGSSAHLTLYCAAGKTGYGSPKWLGFPTAVFDPAVKYTVTYDYNDGSKNTDAIIVFGGGKAINEYPDSDSENSFLGWYKDPGCTKPWRFGTDTVTSNVTLYALWASQNNAFLEGLTLQDADCNYLILSPEFDSNIFTYTASLGQKENGFKVSADADSDSATIYIDGKARDYKEYTAIKAGSSATVTIVVKCGKDKKTYNVIVKKDISTDDDLYSLAAKSGGGDLCFDQCFDPDVLVYNLKLDGDTNSVTISAVKDNALEKVYIDGKAKMSKTYNKIVPGGTVDCVIKVVAQSKDTKIYTVHITRDSDTDAYLKSLKTSLNKYGVNPKFDKENDSYEVYLPENIGSVVLYAQAEGYQASTTFTNNDTKAQSTKGFMKVNVNNGDYVQVNIEVEAQASTDECPLVKDYTVTVYRAAKIAKFGAAPKSGSVPALSPGGDNTLTFNWTQAGDGIVNIEAYVYDKDDAKWEWESINSDNYTDDQPQKYEWNGAVGGDYLDPGTYKVRISVSYKNGDDDYTVISAYKVINVKILPAPHITLTVTPGTITGGGDQTAKISVRWDVLTQVKVQVYDGDDLKVTLTDQDSYPASRSLNLSWDGTDDEGDALDPGTYTITVTAGGATQTAYITITEDASDD